MPSPHTLTVDYRTYRELVSASLPLKCTKEKKILSLCLKNCFLSLSLYCRIIVEESLIRLRWTTNIIPLTESGREYLKLSTTTMVQCKHPHWKTIHLCLLSHYPQQSPDTLICIIPLPQAVILKTIVLHWCTHLILLLLQSLYLEVINEGTRKTKKIHILSLKKVTDCTQQNLLKNGLNIKHGKTPFFLPYIGS